MIDWYSNSNDGYDDSDDVKDDSQIYLILSNILCMIVIWLHLKLGCNKMISQTQFLSIA